MNKKDLIKWGSQTAKGGFRNEDDIVRKFNDWKKDKEAQEWLILMKYKISEIEYVEAVKISGYKIDVQVQVTIKLKKAIETEDFERAAEIRDKLRLMKEETARTEKPENSKV